MSCTAWHDSLTERLYGEIGRDDDVRLTAHLESCASCRETLDGFQRVRSVMREDEQDVRRVPRVVVLRDRFRFRPAMMAASLAGMVVLAGLGAGAGYALGLGHASASASPESAKGIQAAVSTEELVRREVDRRVAALQSSPADASSTKPEGAALPSAAGRPVNQSELRAELAKFERRFNGARAADLDYVLAQIVASEFRVGTSLGKTNQALRTVALVNTPYANEQ